MNTNNWIIDFRSENRANMYRVSNTIASVTSRYQEILIVDTLDFGKALFLDGIPQSSSLDEHIYHEALVHPALIANSNPEKVFIAGGGEGAVLREVLKHNTVKQVVMADIDDVMVDLAKQYLGSWHRGAFDDSRVQVIHEDARAYLARSEEMFDCILVDMTDPLEGSPAGLLFTREFFAVAKSHLNQGGTFAMQAEATDFGEHVAHISIVKTLQLAFQCVMPYQTQIPFYGLAWGFVVAGDWPMEHHLNAHSIITTLRKRNCLDLRFYDPETHLHMFSLPKYLRDALEDKNVGMIISDEQLLIVE